MKKFLGLVLVLMSFAVIGAQAASSATPVKLSLFPPLTVPASKTVHGLDFAIISSIIDETQGVQLAWIYAKSANKVVGVQWALVTKTSAMTGVEMGLVDLADNVTGLQYGFYNSAKSVTGVQLGFINITENMEGIQIGLVNNIKNSKLPWMVIANAKFK